MAHGDTPQFPTSPCVQHAHAAATPCNGNEPVRINPDGRDEQVLCVLIEGHRCNPHSCCWHTNTLVRTSTLVTSGCLRRAQEHRLVDSQVPPQSHSRVPSYRGYHTIRCYR